MVEIPLTHGLVTLVDDEDAHLAQFRWHLLNSGRGSRTQYAGRTRRGPDGRQHHVIIHREIMGAEPGRQVDHINGDGLDNRRANLRFATPAENCRNRPPRKGKQFKGVWDRGRGRWVAQIEANGIQSYLGTFSSPEQAALAYDIAARALHGAFARTNF